VSILFLFTPQVLDVLARGEKQDGLTKLVVTLDNNRNSTNQPSLNL
jgi:hypothetical protein